MRKRLVSVFAVGMLALPGLGAVPAQASPIRAAHASPVSVEQGWVGPLPCTVHYLPWTKCGSVTVPSGSSLYVGVYNTGTVTNGDFRAWNSGSYVNSVFGVKASDSASTFFWKNDTGSAVTLQMEVSAHEHTDGNLVVYYSHYGPNER